MQYYDINNNLEMIKELERKFPLLRFAYIYNSFSEYKLKDDYDQLVIAFRDNVLKKERLKFAEENGLKVLDDLIDIEKEENIPFYFFEINKLDYETGDFVFYSKIKEIMIKYYPKPLIEKIDILQTNESYLEERLNYLTSHYIEKMIK